MDFIRPYIYFIALSFIVSLIVYLKPRNSPLYLRLFPPFLFVTLCIELWGAYELSLRINNLGMYSFFTAFEFCYYLLMLNFIITNKLMKKMIMIIIPVYAIIATINIVFIQGMDRFHITSYSLGCLIIVIVCIYYFFELFRLPKSIDLKANPAFWICSGLLFFYCVSFPLYGFIREWAKFPLFVKNFDAIVNMLNICLYTLFTIGFLCSRTRKYSLSQS
jgi:hypothetical protein